jgi:glycosyltransferase involved in cell wall biosynthesis
VAFVMPGVGVVNRGAEAFVLEIAEALEASGEIRATIFSRGPSPFATERVRVVPRDARWLETIYGSHRLVRKVLDTLYLDPLHLEWGTAALSALPRLARGPRRRRGGYDVVVMEGGLHGARLARLLRRWKGVPFVDVAHGNSPRWEGAAARQRPDRAVAFTIDTAEMIRRQAPRAPREMVEVIPHGVDLDRFSPEGPIADVGLPGPVVLAAGAIDDNKRFHLTVEAIARAPGPLSLLVLGDGPEGAALDRRATETLGPERYRRTTVAREEMPLWYRAADAFTMPSLYESFGLTYLEALACGLPVVAPDDPVRREVIGQAGLYVDPTDPEAYGAALWDAARRPSTDWSEPPRRRAERFPFAATSRAYGRLFREVVHGG